MIKTHFVFSNMSIIIYLFIISNKYELETSKLNILNEKIALLDKAVVISLLYEKVKTR